MSVKGSKARSKVTTEDFISGGGSHAGQPAEENTKTVRVSVYAPPDIVASVDRAISARQIRTSRNKWILEAMVEKLEREGSP